MKKNRFLWLMQCSLLIALAAIMTSCSLRDDTTTTTTTLNPCENSECKVNVININTGYDQINNTTYDVGDPDAYWTLIEYPDIVANNIPNPNGTLNVPTHAWVIDQYHVGSTPVWGILNNSQWISAYNIPDLDDNNPENNINPHQVFDCNNPAPATKPYSFQRCFCTCAKEQIINIDLYMLVETFLCFL